MEARIAALEDNVIYLLKVNKILLECISLFQKFDISDVSNNTNISNITNVNKINNDNDITIICKDKTITTREYILRKNKVFNAMLDANMNESHSNKINLNQYNAEVVQIFIYYNMVGSLPSNYKNEFDLKNFKCVKKLLEMADLYDDDNLYKSLIKYMLLGIDEFLDTQLGLSDQLTLNPNKSHIVISIQDKLNIRFNKKFTYEFKKIPDNEHYIQVIYACNNLSFAFIVEIPEHIQNAAKNAIIENQKNNTISSHVNYNIKKY